MAELLFWPALLCYGEAAVGYFGYVRRAGAAGRAAIWGVRLGWLAQTALLAVQATREDGFPWGTWAGSLNLFVWLVVTVYLGVRRPYRLVGLVLAAFAGFTLAAALSAFYLWQERRLKRREATILRRQAPSLATLDRLASRAVMFSLPVLTLGLAVGLVRLFADGERVDALVAATVVTWLVWAAYLVLRVTRGWTGRRGAYVALVGFALVIVVRLALPATHFA